MSTEMRRRDSFVPNSAVSGNNDEVLDAEITASEVDLERAVDNPQLEGLMLFTPDTQSSVAVFIQLAPRLCLVHVEVWFGEVVKVLMVYVWDTTCQEAVLREQVLVDSTHRSPRAPWQELGLDRAEKRPSVMGQSRPKIDIPKGGKFGRETRLCWTSRAPIQE